ncbi:MAG: hypothetical protein M5U01_14640 [Ardenticatenaceae bacterium]|nr:hypothetical protein [Ardenticatenaceae bacterium]
MLQGTSWSGRAPLQHQVMEIAAYLWAELSRGRRGWEPFIGFGQAGSDLLPARLARAPAGGQALGVGHGGLTSTQVGVQRRFAVRGPLSGQGTDDLREVVIAPQTAQEQGRATRPTEAIHEGLRQPMHHSPLRRGAIRAQHLVRGRRPQGQRPPVQGRSHVGTAHRWQHRGRLLTRWQVGPQGRPQLRSELPVSLSHGLGPGLQTVPLAALMGRGGPELLQRADQPAFAIRKGGPHRPGGLRQRRQPHHQMLTITLLQPDASDGGLRAHLVQASEARGAGFWLPRVSRPDQPPRRRNRRRQPRLELGRQAPHHAHGVPIEPAHRPLAQLEPARRQLPLDFVIFRAIMVHKFSSKWASNFHPKWTRSFHPKWARAGVRRTSCTEAILPELRLHRAWEGHNGRQESSGHGCV